MSKESTPFSSMRSVAELSFETKNAAYVARMRTARKRNMVAGATALRRECTPRRTLFYLQKRIFTLNPMTLYAIL